MGQGMPIVFAQQGERTRIQEIIGSETLVIRLREMGFINGGVVKVVRNDNGPLILGVGDSRVVLSRGMASKIVVIKM